MTTASTRITSHSPVRTLKLKRNGQRTVIRIVFHSTSHQRFGVPISGPCPTNRYNYRRRSPKPSLRTCGPITLSRTQSNATRKPNPTRKSRVLLDSPDANKWERAHLTESTTEEEKMKGSIIDDTTAIGKRLDELTSKQVAVIKTAAPPPRRLPVCLRCDDTGWMP